MSISGRVSFAALALSLCVLAPPAAAETGLFWGRVVDPAGRAVPGARLSLRSASTGRVFTTTTDGSGSFSLVGLPSGTYALEVGREGFEPGSFPAVWLDPGGEAYRKIEWGRTPPAESRDSALPTVRTVISRPQIERLPTVHSVWSLIENQDFSATTNRVDVGGSWGTVPALFSARGGTSWTQNVYSLNGFDVTDPFQPGVPLFIPDIFALEETSLANAALPARSLSPGGFFELRPREGGEAFSGGASGFYLDKTLSTTNITPALVAEGMTETNSLNRILDLNLHAGGPMGGGDWRFFASLTSQSAGRDLAQFVPEDSSRLTSGFFHLTRAAEKGPNWRVLWTGQIVDRPTSGAGRKIPPETTWDERDVTNVLQVSLESGPRPRSSYRFGVSFGRADSKKDFQSLGPAGPPGEDLITGIPQTTAPYAATDARTRLSAVAEGETFLANLGPTHHRLRYGLELKASFSRSRMSVADNLRLRFFEGRGQEVVRYESPFSHAESSAEIALFAEEKLFLPGGFSLTLGLQGNGAFGRNPAQTVRWLNLSPRLAVDLPLSSRRSSRIRLAAARYYGLLPLSYLAWGHPAAPGGLAYAWNDLDGDGAFQPAEQGHLLRREGPRFGAISPDLKRPQTDEFLVALLLDFGGGWSLSAAGFMREGRNLVETENTGVPPSSYIPFTLADAGDDRVVGTPDDLLLTVFGQKAETLGRDFFLLGNPSGSRVSTYKGFDLVLTKRPSEGLLFFLAATATEAYQTNSPGNTERENDDGVIGALYDNPNAGVNARGRPRFDRAYTARLGFALALPLDFAAGAVLKYYDGQPFTRKIVVTGLAQGPFTVMAFPRGVARYEFNMTVDVRLEKRFRLGRAGLLRLMVDVFNLFNQHLATEESPWTNDAFPLRFATEIQSPRVARLGLKFEF